MCIYCGTNKYRKIYESHYGPIPKDAQGRSYEIHHIDGNRKNNNLDNLTCVSIQEHFDIHYSQREWGACFRISKRMNLPPDKLSEILSSLSKQRVSTGKHHFLGGKIQGNASRARVDNQTHHFLGGQIQKVSNQKRILQGTHNLCGENNPSKRLVEQGKHHFQKQWKCPHCNRNGKGIGLYNRWHGNNCKNYR